MSDTDDERSPEETERRMINGLKHALTTAATKHDDELERRRLRRPSNSPEPTPARVGKLRLLKFPL